MTADTTTVKRRIVVCRGQYCNMGRRADKIFSRLEELVTECTGDQLPNPVKLEIANCLSMCGAGPNLVIYPEGIVYNGVELSMLPAILDAHLKT